MYLVKDNTKQVQIRWSGFQNKNVLWSSFCQRPSQKKAPSAEMLVTPLICQTYRNPFETQQSWQTLLYAQKSTLCQFVQKANPVRFPMSSRGCHCDTKPEHTQKQWHAAVINESSVINPISCAASWTLCFPLRSPEDHNSARKWLFLCDTGSKALLHYLFMCPAVCKQLSRSAIIIALAVTGKCGLQRVGKGTKAEIMYHWNCWAH